MAERISTLELTEQSFASTIPPRRKRLKAAGLNPESANFDDAVFLQRSCARSGIDILVAVIEYFRFSFLGSLIVEDADGRCSIQRLGVCRASRRWKILARPKRSSLKEK